jgi:hypothetical protein
MNTHSYLRFVAAICLVLIVALMITACAGGGSQALPASSASTAQPTSSAAQSASGQQTFGKEDCAKLLSFEEIEAALGTAVDVVNVEEEGTCDYEDKNGFGVLSVILASDSQSSPPCTASDGTYLGKPVEKIDGVGDNAVWSSDVQTVCFNKGNQRVQISLGVPVPQNADPKTVATDLARKAVARLP